MRTASTILLLAFLTLTVAAQKTVPIADPKQPDPGPVPKLVELLKPDYPADDLADVTLHSEILVSLKVDKNGKLSIIGTSGPMAPCSDLNDKRVKKLRDASIEAVKHSKFEPAIENGKPVDSYGTVRYSVVDNTKAKPSADGAKRIKGGVLNGKAISLPRPEYPPQARAQHAGGAVSVQVTIDENGKVMGISFLGGHPNLKDSVLNAACSAKFSPTLLAGQPVKVTGIITYNFIP